MNRTKKIVGAAVLSVFGLAAVGMAGEGGRFGRGEGRMHGRHGFGMGMRDLNLSDEQKAQLKQIHEQQREVMKPLVEQQKQLRDQMEQFLASGKPDATRIGQLQIQLFALRGQFRAQREKMQQEFVNVLTPEQKAQWEKSREERKQRFEERRQERQQHDHQDQK